MTLKGPGDGLLPIDKPTGPTSHDIVARGRRALGIRRIGHSGTLDPFASGLLLLLVGGATRLAEYLAPLPKEYVARVRLGIRTSTDDPEGEVVAESDEWHGLSLEAVETALEPLRGEIEQMPPRYSAKKVAGRPAHRRVRAGEDVVLEPAKVVIHEIAVEAFDLPWVAFRVRCSTGTYIRALARDLGESLGVGAHLAELRRTRIGPFRVEDALPVGELELEESVSRALVSPLDALGHIERVDLDEESAARVRMGQFLAADAYGLPAEKSLLALSCGGQLVAVASVQEGRIRPRKVMAR